MNKLIQIIVSCLVVAIATPKANADSNFGEGQPDFRSSYCKKRDSTPIDTLKLQNFVATSPTAFGLGLYKKIAKESKSDTNIIFSPISAYLLLTMVASGSQNHTREELLTGLHIPPRDRKSFVVASGEIMAQLLCPNSYSTLDLSIANGIFKQNGKALRNPFLTALKDNFDATPTEVNFSTPGPAVKTINAWVSEKTAGKIENLISESAISRETKMILVNAMHLKDSWDPTFAEKETKPRTFFHANGKKSKIPMMHRKGAMGDYDYVDKGDYAVATLKTSSKDLDLIIFLPRQTQGIYALEKKMDEGTLAEVFRSLQPHRLNVTLPKFKITDDLPLTDKLMELGFKQMFLPRVADFSMMDGGADQLYVSAVIQKAMIEVNEKGLEAAAATAALMVVGAMPPKPSPPVNFVADHPFLYVVRHRRTNALLFMGRVM